MGKLIIRISILSVIIVALWFVGQYYNSTVLRHRTEINYMNVLAERIKHYRADDVKSVTILLYSTDEKVVLDPQRDRAEIVRLMNSLKHIKVENRERRLGIGMGGCLIVKFEKRIDGFSGFRIDGNFDPKDAPIITRSMRSDDLGQIVYDIFRSKGIDLKSDERS